MKRVRKDPAAQEEGKGGKAKQELQEEEKEVEDGKMPDIVLLRQKNIARNKAMMAALSLNQKSKPVVSTAAKNRTAAQSASALDSPTTGTDEAGVAAAPLRKSRRLNGETIDPDNGLLALPGTWLSCLTHVPKDRETAPTPTRHDYGPELSKEEANEKIKVLQEQIDAADDAKAGTASYHHCLHRVRTMSETQLAGRVRAIERARGAKAIQKMLVFTHVLRAKEMNDLLAYAEAALDRLVRGLPMPEKKS